MPVANWLSVHIHLVEIVDLKPRVLAAHSCFQPYDNGFRGVVLALVVDLRAIGGCGRCVTTHRWRSDRAVGVSRQRGTSTWLVHAPPATKTAVYLLQLPLMFRRL